MQAFSGMRTLVRSHSTSGLLAAVPLARIAKTMTFTQEHGNTTPWYSAYPAPRHMSPGSLTREEVLKMIKAQDLGAGQDFVLVDLRRNDHEGGTIRGSINLPAQSLYPTIPALYNMFKAAGLRKIIWYCSSSRGRGTRAAGWFSDYIADHGNGKMQSLILFEGIEGWATAGGEYAEWMDEYDATVWASK